MKVRPIIAQNMLCCLLRALFEADTGMSWTEAVEQSNETANSIISEMWVKSVS